MIRTHHERIRMCSARRLTLPLLALTLALGVARNAAADPQLASVSGLVEIGSGEPPSWRAARTGDVVHAGERVRTARGARAELALGGATVRLYESSLLRIPAEAASMEEPDGVGLDGGTGVFDVRPRPPGRRFEVITPEVVASVKGTRFSVSVADDAAAVTVMSGLVGVRAPGRGDTEVLVRQGFAASGGLDRAFELRLVPELDVWDSWSDLPTPPAGAVPAAAPPPREAALGDARLAATRAADPEVVKQALARDPGLAAKLVRAEHEAKGGGAVPAALDAGALPDPGTGSDIGIDPVVKAGTGATEPAVQKSVVEAVLNGGVAGSAAGGTGVVPGAPSVTDVLNVALLDSKGEGAERVVVSGGAGVLGQFTESQLEAILEKNDAKSLGAALLTQLASRGIDPIQFTKQLKGLFD